MTNCADEERKFDSMFKARNEDVAARAEFSRDAFKKYVKPVIETVFFLKKIISTEEQNSELERLLDFCGIDCIAVTAQGLIPIASRVQSVRASYDSFTIRKNSGGAEFSEFAKLQTKGYLRPEYVAHAYVTKNGATVGLAKADAVINYLTSRIDEELPVMIRSSKGTDDEFYCVDWKELVYRADSELLVFYVNTAGKISPMFHAKVAEDEYEDAALG